MIKSMTGFGGVKGCIVPWGRVNVEIRSVNHRFLDIVLHLPEGLLHLEQKFKDEITKRIKRGHVVCRLEINHFQVKRPVLNKPLIKEYYLSLKQISRQLNLRQEINIDTLVGLPGVWSVQSPRSTLSIGWLKVKPLLKKALDRVIQRREQEGRALCKDLNARIRNFEQMLRIIKARFNKAVKQELKAYKPKEEQNSLLKNSDINEEIVRMDFHAQSLTRRLKNKKAVGKELDFILQEMQREANTTGAKSIDALISSKIVGMKSEIEKMREQVQNVE